MDLLFVIGCLCALIVPVLLGLAISYIFERYIGGWAFVAGTIIPVILVATLYTVNFIWTRAMGCEPVGSLACGEPFVTAFILFLGVMLFVTLANAAAQFAFYVFLNNLRNPPFPAAATYQPAPVPGYPTQPPQAETSPEIAQQDPAAFAPAPEPEAAVPFDEAPHPVSEPTSGSQNVYDWAPKEGDIIEGDAEQRPS